MRRLPPFGSFVLSERTARPLLGGMCIAVLCGILVAGLWPFHSPRNGVTWLAGENGLRFTRYATIVSAGEFRAAGAPGSSCSVEVWLQPALLEDSNTLLAFHNSRPASLSLHQSISDLDIKRGEGRTEHFYIDNAFRPLRPLFISVSSGEQGTAVYINGVLARAAPRFRIAAGDCTGRLVVATSPVGNSPWTGQLKGLAIYHRELTVAEVLRHYLAWTGQGRPDLTGDPRCVALYLFDEHGGSLVHNRMGPGPDLWIPERYRIEDQAFLAPFWEQEFDLPDILRNIVAFVPLGFFLYAWLSLRPSAKRTALTVTLLGALVSVTMEVLQAHLPTRQSDTTDILTNTFGTWAGVVLYRYLAARRS